MKQEPNTDGYPSVRIYVDGQRKRVPVYKIMAMCFLPARPSDAHEVRHLDGNKLNSHASNLSWGTRKDNADDRERHGRTSRGETHSVAIRRGLAVSRG